MSYKQNDEVRFSWNNVSGTGRIKGKATTEVPVIGAMWIVEIEESTIDALLYPYSCISLPEHSITPKERE